jgi:hypothetical protein
MFTVRKFAPNSFKELPHRSRSLLGKPMLFGRMAPSFKTTFTFTFTVNCCHLPHPRDPVLDEQCFGPPFVCIIAFRGEVTDNNKPLWMDWSKAPAMPLKGLQRQMYTFAFDWKPPPANAMRSSIPCHDVIACRSSIIIHTYMFWDKGRHFALNSLEQLTHRSQFLLESDQCCSEWWHPFISFNPPRWHHLFPFSQNYIWRKVVDINQLNNVSSNLFQNILSCLADVTANNCKWRHWCRMSWLETGLN